MKKLLVLASLLLSTYSAHATTVVAEDTAEHTITLNFGRPTSDSYLCRIMLNGSNYSNLDTITFPSGDTLNGVGQEKYFTRENSPSSSTLHLGSPNYGSQLIVQFCHDLRVPGGNPGGQIDNFYKIQTPSTWSYFSNSDLRGQVYSYCPAYGIDSATNGIILSTNTATDYTLVTTIPFAQGEAITSDPDYCRTTFIIFEGATGPRTPDEISGNITVGVKNVINFN